jgi:uncharacterized protein (DUF427 family)
MIDEPTTERHPSKESVWDYPRPPRVEPSVRHVVVEYAGITIADTRRAARVLETSHPPVYYIPPDDVAMRYLTLGDRHTFCEFKGVASYYNLAVGERRVAEAAWTYLEPSLGYESIRGYLAFYPGKVDACFVDEEKVRVQAGGFYGGWITTDIVGPFKGEPGTEGW